MKYRALGTTGLMVSEVGFGAWAIGGNVHGNSYGSTDEEESLRALQKAYELGCNFFDTADIYGHGESEILLGKALKSWNRDKVVLATKVGGNFYDTHVRMDFSKQHIRYGLEQSLKRLETEAIDVYQLHNPPLELVEEGSIFDVLKVLQTEGKIRHFGISIHDSQEGLVAIEQGPVESIQVVYNLFDRRPEAALFSEAQKNNVGIIAREPLANGFLTGKFSAEELPQFEAGDIRSHWPKPYLKQRIQMAEMLKQLRLSTEMSLTTLALKFVLAQPAVSVVIPGCKTEAQVVENFAVSSQPDLSEADLEAVFNSLKVRAHS
jgi:aryl-alcohol dehydrogenase-like predicted oxidoreductase